MFKYYNKGKAWKRYIMTWYPSSQLSAPWPNALFYKIDVRSRIYLCSATKKQLSLVNTGIKKWNLNYLTIFYKNDLNTLLKIFNSVKHGILLHFFLPCGTISDITTTTAKNHKMIYFFITLLINTFQSDLLLA